MVSAAPSTAARRRDAVPPCSVKAPVLVSSLTSVDICSEMRPVAQDDRREGQADAEMLELDGDVAVLVAR